MNAPATLDQRRSMAEAEAEAAQLAAVTLEKILTRIAELALRAEHTAGNFPKLGLDPLFFRSLRGSAGVLLGALENAPGVRWGRG